MKIVFSENAMIIGVRFYDRQQFLWLTIQLRSPKPLLNGVQVSQTQVYTYGEIECALEAELHDNGNGNLNFSSNACVCTRNRDVR